MKRACFATVFLAALLAALTVAPAGYASEGPAYTTVCRPVVRCAPAGGINRTPERHCRSVRKCVTQQRYRRLPVQVRRCETITTGRDARGTPRYSRYCRTVTDYRFVRVPEQQCHYVTVCGARRAPRRTCHTVNVCERRQVEP